MSDWYKIVFELIDMRSFSNLWYWIGLAALWSTASHYVLGVPYDMVTRGKRLGGEAEADLHDLVRVNVNRLLYIASTAGLWLVAIAFFMLTTLAVLAFVYWIEFAQAMFFLALPMSIVYGLSIRAAQGIHAADGADLYGRLHRHRLVTQFVGMLSILVTVAWGMWQNFVMGAI